MIGEKDTVDVDELLAKAKKPAADAMVLHVYMGSGLKKLRNQRAAAGQKETGDSDEQPDAWYASPEIQERELEVLKTPEGAELFLSMPFRAVAQSLIHFRQS